MDASINEDKYRRNVDSGKYDSLVEAYSPERIAEFLLNNAINEEHYQRQREEVRKMGLDPDKIPHDKPPVRA